MTRCAWQMGFPGRFVLMFAGLLVSTLLGMAEAAPYSRRELTPDIPQRDLTYTNSGRSFCGPCATANGLCWLAANGYDRLIPGGGGDLERHRELVKLLGSTRYMQTGERDQTGPGALATGVKRYISDCGYEVGQLETITLKPDGGTGTLLAGVEERLRKAMSASNSFVVLHLGWFKRVKDSTDYERKGGHYVTAVAHGLNRAGVADDRVVVIHDPWTTNGNIHVTMESLAEGALVVKKGGQITRQNLRGAVRLGGELSISSKGDIGLLDHIQIIELAPASLSNHLARAADPVVAAAARPPAVREDRRTWDFGDVHFSNQFPGGRLEGCSQEGDGRYVGVISPENTPINTSPWYAFKVWADGDRLIRISLTNTYSAQRGRPWVSRDGVKWERMGPGDCRPGDTPRVAVLSLKVGRRPTWVATQELIGLKELGDWTDRKSRLPFVRSSIIGKSVEGRPLKEFVLGAATNRNYLFIIGRQHPPEVTGSLGLMAFVDAIAGNTRLAKKFRNRFQTVVIPVVNPDGVERGHWRSNMGGVDLNRDWNTFLQPESGAVSRALMKHANEPGAKPFVFIDFHSTHTNVFYLQPEVEGDARGRFARQWLGALEKRAPWFKFERDAAYNVGAATSKAWAGEKLGAASLTWEFGYGTDREHIRRVAPLAAAELMRLLLEDEGSRSTSLRGGGGAIAY